MGEIQDRVTKQQTITVSETPLIIACTANGTRYLSVSAICKALKIDHRTQIRRIRNTAALRGHLRQLELHFLSGGKQPVYCLPVEVIPAWLSPQTGMQPDTVKPLHQSLLHIFQQGLLPLVDQVCPLPRPQEIPFQEGRSDRQEEEAEATSKALVVSSEDSTLLSEETPLAAQHVLATRLPQTIEKPRLIIPLYTHEEHIAFREASVAKGHRWTNEEESDEDPYFRSSSTGLQVYVSRPSQPIGLDAAMRRIAALGPSTVLVARIAFGLWNARRNDPLYAEGGWIAIQVEEFLLLRHVQMHTRAVVADAESRTSDGVFERKFIERLQEDLELLNGSHIRRWVTPDNYYDSPYLRVSMLMERKARRRGQEKKEKDRLVRVAVSPGEWMPVSIHQTFDKFSRIDERILSLSLKTDVYAILISLFLTERWRQQALLEMERQMSGGVPSGGTDPLYPYREPIQVKDLLEASIIDIDHTNLTSRFAPAIETALQRLVEKKILAKESTLQVPLNREKNWGHLWLTSSVVLLPLLDTEEKPAERSIGVVDEAYQLSLLPGPVEKQRTRRAVPPPPTS